MKKRLTLFSLLLLFTMTAMAQLTKVVVGGIYYYLYESSNVAEVTSGTGYRGDIVIPASISVDGVDYSVTWIGRSAFNGSSGLTSIEIPTSVTEIGEGAFSHCYGLTSIEIPNSVTSIGNSAFSACSGLTSIVVEEGNSYYDSRENCNAIIETSSNTLIAGCQNTVIPNSVTEIGDAVFSWNSGLTSIEIPNSVTLIGDDAFYGCSGLTSIEIPNSVTWIGELAFSNCSGLTSIVVEEGNSYYDSRENCNALIETSSNTLLAGCQNTVIPNSVTSIGDDAFDGCSSLTSIEIPNSVTEIGEYAFEDCFSLTSIEIPNSVTEIGEGAFSSCYDLTSIEIPNSMTSIGDHTFYNCSGLTSIEIPNSVTEIGIYAFTFCSGLTSIEIPTSVTEIGEGAFSHCYGLTSISMQRATPPTVGGDLFYKCRKLETIYVPVGASEAYNVAPWNAYNIVEKEIEIINPMLVDGLYYNVDVENKTAEVVAAPNDTKYSGDIVIPASISVYGVDYSVTSIGSSAFFDCSSLTSIEIPNSVTEIGYAAFYNCSSLTSIEIPNSVISIGDYAFTYSSGLTSIELPNSVTSIENYAFAECSGLTSIEIPNSVTSIGNYAFGACSGLRSIEIPNSVTSIGYGAFYNCSGLTSITMQRATPPTIGDNLFEECSKLETIYVPVGASEAYNVAPWNKYNIVEGEVTGIESVTQEEWPADVYDLNGRMVKAQAENLDELPKGVYIVNGKKFVK